MSANNSKLSPRQKMINLMYIVFLAMVALNVSSDVLSGFKHVEDALDAGNQGAQSRNKKLFDEFSAIYEKNSEKAGTWYTRAQSTRRHAAEMYALIDSIKLQIVQMSDGEDGDPDNIRNRENLEAVNQIMLQPRYGAGLRLRTALEDYRQTLMSYVPASDAQVIANYLSTEIPEGTNLSIKDWETAMFENIPVAAAVTILAKIQGDVLNAEGETIASLMQSVDRGDVRVNQLSAFVIPNSRNVMRGQKYEAQIVMAAIDSTQTPQIYIGNQLYDAEKNGYYSVVASREGIQNISGYLEVAKPDGTSEQLPFETSYFVSEPLATISNTMMNVMYAGIDNPVSISVPGVAASQISASMTNGTLTRSGNGWVAKPKEVDKDAVITVTANQNGRSMQVSQMSFRVRRLPDPTPYIAYKDQAGNTQRYKGGVPIAKAQLLNAGGIKAAIDDGLLNVEFQVKSFRVDIFDSMGNDIPEDSQSSEFSSRQLEALRRLGKGKTFFITRVKAVGPDGIERTLSPIQVIL
ncbi:MAG: gliding motility protein GldM [Bacteroidales bacterium]|nr:gliding motility protein GldM [Candidatus Liminaster caballi]